VNGLAPLILCGLAGVVASWPLLTIAHRFAPSDAVSHEGSAGSASPAPLVAGLTAVLFAAVGFRFGLDPAVPAYLVLIGALVVQSIIDLRVRRLPREITYTALGGGGVLLAAAALGSHDPTRLWRAMIGATVALAAMWLVHVASRGDLGDGDVRLAPLLGLYLGYVSLESVAVGLTVGFLLGAVLAIALMARHRPPPSLPFGPFLAAGTLATLLVAGPSR